jgi:uncharacterized protein with von Willebrand factor type A (vWA) domain
LVASLFIANWEIGSGHIITLITVIAALLLFRYYSTIKLANLLEFSNTQKAADTTSKNAEAMTKKVQEIISKVQNMATMAENRHSEISHFLDAPGVEGIAPLSNTTSQFASETQNAASELKQDLQELQTIYNALQNSRTELDVQRKIMASKLNRI